MVLGDRKQIPGPQIIHPRSAMKIAITADVHLTSKSHHPERFNALRDILMQCQNIGVDRLILAGDLFDQTTNNPAEFELLVKEHAHPDLQVLVIPGNHDAGLNDKMFTHPAINVFTEPALLDLGSRNKFLLVPYKSNSNMGNQLAEFFKEGEIGSFILISHGDWVGGKQQRNLYEEGTYMPLLSADLQKYDPYKVFLGHIHIPNTDRIVSYTGSPCGVDITETGQRSFILYDTTSENFERVRINTDVVYLNEKVTVLPSDDELGWVKKIIMERINANSLEPAEIAKLSIRLELLGYSQNKAGLISEIKVWLKEQKFKVDLQDQNLKFNDDPTLRMIAEKVTTNIMAETYSAIPGYPTKDEILSSALTLIYEEN